MIAELIQNKIILSCFLAWVVTQTSKGIIIGYKKKKFKLEYLLATGHMPSSHAGIVSSLVSALYLNQKQNLYSTIATHKNKINKRKKQP